RAMILRRVGLLALVVAMLSLGKPVLMPIALAFYLTFVLTPPSDRLERWGMPRPVSVTLVFAAALGALVGLGSILVSQAAELAGQLKTYSAQMGDKLANLRRGGLGAFSDLDRSFSDLGKAFDPEWALNAAPAPVRVIAEGSSPLVKAEHALGPVLGPLAFVTIVVVMAIFMLAHREDLRGRLIQLVGPRNVTLTTRTMADAVNRVSFLLLTQAYVNAATGAVISIGLYFIGIPYAVLWGALASLLRFVPLLGTLIATILPTLAAFAIFPGWHEALLTAGLFIGVDTLVANFIEPWIIGKRTGVSALALLISALFWTWLWGPFGLLLATPITVCAATVSRHVPELAFLNVLLGDETGLESRVNFYQRVLAKAAKDALRLAKRHAASGSLSHTFDELLVPTLELLAADEQVGAVEPEAAAGVVADLRDIARKLATQRPPAKSPARSLEVLGIASDCNADALLLEMLAFGAASLDVRVIAPAPRPQVLASAEASAPRAICIAALSQASNVNARFYCRRLRLLFPQLPILVLSPDIAGKRAKEADARLREAGATDVVGTIGEAAVALSALLETAPSSGRLLEPPTAPTQPGGLAALPR
ncbi:MAG TPA: AI-2E family transporter, partial [Polyangiaceae bacterium]|nr:AI-2E family transporter [Polyangiaceae bacterium]